MNGESSSLHWVLVANDSIITVDLITGREKIKQVQYVLHLHIEYIFDDAFSVIGCSCYFSLIFVNVTTNVNTHTHTYIYL